MKHIGLKIKYWRERRFLSVRRLSLTSGVAEETISDLENGIRKPRRETIEKLVKALGITLDELADTEPERVLAAS